ncbi:cupin [Ruminococcaceae bacterium OttesenSCG-928-N02]|nr:cupin [Ruminococcaceae bacterium OttesenSCG-928-N02]
MNVKTEFETGMLITATGQKNAKETAYIPHASFQGVSLKLLTGAQDTDGAVSVHLVRVEPHCCLETHTHPQNLEIHKVVAGSGVAEIGTCTGPYHAGALGVIPMGVPHKVTAGADGLYILATFSPALA